ncbi:MAG: DUF2764 family protein [Deltaproteobacteria bacterium]|nr:DUF2764 family protein [Deltaproteobacteria bacterium]
MIGGVTYVGASLPYLTLEGAPPFPYRDFLARCSEWLSAGDFTQLELARIDIENVPSERVRNGMTRRWMAFENALRNLLVKRRAKDLGWGEDEYLRPDLFGESDLSPVMDFLIREVSPLEAEKALVRLRWNFLENRDSGTYFDLSSLILYGLKLQLLEHLNAFDKEKGMETLGLVLDSHAGAPGGSAM